MPNRIISGIEAGGQVYDIYGKGNENNNSSNTNTPFVFDWVGTSQEYVDQNIAIAHPDWVCFITDDVTGGYTVYTKSETDDLLAVKANDSGVVHLAGAETVTGEKTFGEVTKHSKEVIVTNTVPHAQFRAVKDNYGFMIRNDGSNTYFLLTNSGDQYGTWNAFRPLTVNNANGTVTCSTEWTFTEIISGRANRANWADLAENYKTDAKYPVGTLIKFGGEKDITIADTKCNGVISDKPGYLLDSELEDSLPVALVGKTPIRIIGKVNKFDDIALNHEANGVGKVAELGDLIIAKALESSDDENEKLVMCVTKFNLD